jgi:hypothetical protein
MMYMLWCYKPLDPTPAVRFARIVCLAQGEPTRANFRCTLQSMSLPLHSSIESLSFLFSRVWGDTHSQSPLLASLPTLRCYSARLAQLKRVTYASSLQAFGALWELRYGAHFFLIIIIQLARLPD